MHWRSIGRLTGILVSNLAPLSNFTRDQALSYLRSLVADLEGNRVRGEFVSANYTDDGMIRALTIRTARIEPEQDEPDDDDDFLK